MTPAQKYSILIVDDRPENITLINELLVKLDYEKKVYSAPNGKVGYELAQKFLPDLILTDWEMPIMNGLELVKALKKNPLTQTIPVVMITGVMTNPESLKVAFDAGIHDFIVKPFHELEFKARLMNTLRLKKSVEEIQEARDLATRESESLKLAIAQVEKINTKLNEFAYIVTHDLKAPLRGVKKLVDFILEDIEAEEWEEIPEHGAKLIDRVERMEKLIIGILRYSKSEDNLNSTTSIELNGLLTQIEENLDPPAGMKIEIQQNFPQLKADPVKIEQIFQNLIGNAVKYHDKPEGIIHVKWEDNDKFWQFSIEDDGPGIPPEYHERIFKMFQRLPTNQKTGSTGIGLAIVKKIIAEYGGGIKVHSDGVRGTKMVFQLNKEFTGVA